MSAIKFCKNIGIPYNKMVISKNEIAFYFDNQKLFYIEHNTRFDWGETVTLTDLTGTFDVVTSEK
jgi:hypothetical protein